MRLHCTYTQTSVAFAEDQHAVGGLGPGGKQESFRVDVRAHWIGEQDGRLQWLRPEAGAFCCARLNPDTFGPPGVRRFYDRLAEQRTVIAPGPWFGDNAHVIRIGLAYETDGQMEKGLEVISDALRP